MMFTIKYICIGMVGATSIITGMAMMVHSIIG